jgi:hypothetical protein
MPTGTTTMTDGTANFGPFTLMNGTALCPVGALPFGSQRIQISDGDSNFLAQQKPLVETVKNPKYATRTTVVSSAR